VTLAVTRRAGAQPSALVAFLSSACGLDADSSRMTLDWGFWLLFVPLPPPVFGRLLLGSESSALHSTP
jgi:hypothetical protein